MNKLNSLRKLQGQLICLHNNLENDVKSNIDMLDGIKISGMLRGLIYYIENCVDWEKEKNEQD